MSTQIETGEREVVLLEDAHIRPMMGPRCPRAPAFADHPVCAGRPLHPRP